MIDRVPRPSREDGGVHGSPAAHRRAPLDGGSAASLAGTLLGLQRSVGNRAVSDLVAIQRDATTSTLDRGSDPTPTTPSGGGGMLSYEQRAELRRATGGRITRAFMAFVTACEQNRAAIKAAAADSADFGSILLEILLGRLLPGISKGIANLAADIPAAASTTGYRVALAALNQERTTALLERGVQVGKEYLKGGAQLEGETEIDEFLNSLEDQFARGADAIDQDLPNLSDEALGVLWAAYDPSVAGRPQFRAAVRDLVQRYEREVMPIGTTEYHWMNRSSSFNLAWVVSPNGTKRLALMENNDLEQWISRELEGIAIRKYAETPAGRLANGKVPEIAASSVGALRG